MTEKPRRKFFRLRIESDHEPVIDYRTTDPDLLDEAWKDIRKKLSRK